MTKNILRSSIRQFKAEGNKNFKNLEARIDVSSKEKMCLECDGASLVAQLVKNPPAM